MRVKNIPIKQIIPYARNPRDNLLAVDKVAASIKEFGWRQPIVVDTEMVIVAGHTRLLAAQKLGMTKAPVHVADGLSKAQIKAYRIADNRVSELADWDDELLALELADLQGDIDLSLTGFDDDDIQRLLNESSEGKTDPDDVPDIPDNPISVVGDLWILGNHRLMCGDSTDSKNAEKLMDGCKADITFTSPVYNVGKTPNGNAKKYLHDSDNKSINEYKELLNMFTKIALTVSDYVFVNIQSLAGNKISLIEYMYDMRDKYADSIIWNKKTAEPAMARRVLNSQFEYVHIFSNESKRSIGKRDFRGTLTNIIEINSRQDKQLSSIHKATFPIEFAEYFIKNFTETSCFDPFGGTGTTLIACEKTDRNCFMMELEPKYCDVIIKRWQDFTGEKAIHENGKLFNKMPKKRGSK